jgi:hypothetical protein
MLDMKPAGRLPRAAAPHRRLPAGHHLARSRRYPAGDLISLYRHRWEIETAYLELKSSILGGRVLRARTPAGIAQELYALLGLLPDHAHRHHRRNRGRRPHRSRPRQLHHRPERRPRPAHQAANIIAGAVIDLIVAIGRRILDNLLPDRRLRVSPRIVKRAISKYQARGPNINRRSYKATLEIDILAAPGP